MSRMEKAPLGTAAAYIRPSGAVPVRTELSCPWTSSQPCTELEHSASWNQGWRHEILEVEVGLGWKNHPWRQRRGTTGRVEQSGQRRAHGLSRGRLGLGRHEWSFGKRGSGPSGVRV